MRTGCVDMTMTYGRKRLNVEGNKQRLLHVVFFFLLLPTISAGYFNTGPRACLRFDIGRCLTIRVKHVKRSPCFDSRKTTDSLEVVRTWYSGKHYDNTTQQRERFDVIVIYPAAKETRKLVIFKLIENKIC